MNISLSARISELVEAAPRMKTLAFAKAALPLLMEANDALGPCACERREALIEEALRDA